MSILRITRRRHRVPAWGWITTLCLLIAAIRTWPVYFATGGGLLGLGAVFWAVRGVHRWWFVHHRRIGHAPITVAAYHAGTPAQFEDSVADLYRRDGCRNVQVVGGANDRAADVLATLPSGERAMTQCKRYAPGRNVDADTVYAVNGTYRDWHRCQRAIIVTTSDFTPSARQFAKEVGIRLVDGRQLARWASGTGPAPWH